MGGRAAKAATIVTETRTRTVTGTVTAKAKESLATEATKAIKDAKVEVASAVFRQSQRH